MYRSFCAVVTQFDRNWTWLTCREHLQLAYGFFQASLTKGDREAATSSLLERTGLASCSELMSGTDVPEELAPAGLSGGQRRRLSLAVALAKSPLLLIADEPTSGLDAAAAAAIMTVIRNLATKDRVAVVCTIHQPSASVFDCLDQLLVLSKGCTAYLGPACKLVHHAAALGKPVSPGVSIAEHFLNLVNADFASDESVDSAIDAWRSHAPPLPPPPVAGSLPAEPLRASFALQTRRLIERHVVKILPRDPLHVLLTMALALFDVSTIGLYFWSELRTDDQNTPANRLMYAMMTITASMLYNIFYTISASVERVRVKREIDNGMYSPLPYVFVTSLIALFNAIVTIVVVMLLAYVWGDLHSWGSLGYSIVVVSLAQFFFMGVAQLLGWFYGILGGSNLFSIIFTVAMSTRASQASKLHAPSLWR